MLVRLRVRVDAGDARRAARQHGGAVALAAGHVDDVEPRDALGDPLVDGEVALEPVVLLGTSGQRALAGERERRNALGLVLLRVFGFCLQSGGEYSPAPPMATATADNIRDVNIRYHDLAAADYDAKWGIDYGEAGQAQVLGKLAKALGSEPLHYDRALEIGAGTGYFTLNLLRAGVIARGGRDRHLAGHARDAVRRRPTRLGLDVRAIRCEADRLPFPDESFDLVFGHAVLHHLPDLEAAFAEFRRVLKPGGTSCSAASRRATATDLAGPEARRGRARPRLAQR